jgi:hypothetical protein
LATAAVGDILFIHFRARGSVAGEAISWEGVDCFDFRGEEAVRGTGFFDPRPMLNAAGLDSSAERSA